MMKHFKHESATVVPGPGYLKRVLIDESSLGIPGSYIQEVEFRKGMSSGSIITVSRRRYSMRWTKRSL